MEVSDAERFNQERENMLAQLDGEGRAVQFASSYKTASMSEKLMLLALLGMQQTSMVHMHTGGLTSAVLDFPPAPVVRPASPNKSAAARPAAPPAVSHVAERPLPTSGAQPQARRGVRPRGAGVEKAYVDLRADSSSIISESTMSLFTTTTGILSAISKDESTASDMTNAWHFPMSDASSVLNASSSSHGSFSLFDSELVNPHPEHRHSKRHATANAPAERPPLNRSTRQPAPVSSDPYGRHNASRQGREQSTWSSTFGESAASRVSAADLREFARQSYG